MFPCSFTVDVGGRPRGDSLDSPSTPKRVVVSQGDPDSYKYDEGQTAFTADEPGDDAAGGKLPLDDVLANLHQKALSTIG